MKNNIKWNDAHKVQPKAGTSSFRDKFRSKNVVILFLKKGHGDHLYLGEGWVHYGLGVDEKGFWNIVRDAHCMYKGIPERKVVFWCEKDLIFSISEVGNRGRKYKW